ncbi:hypothetical protein AKJ47_00820 [candidate division MSBL1 archaeon SCGC-AAA261G05]|uniref:Uncharacterized protein n=2 Tax=candidate division MSBL1 TaxID=215777 RepID=A0A133V1I6_9EURY|nr:hypothetical protein AKJ42_01120 [candidate division MSBL1 archaeon SCGC-AAA261C02]KXB04070.1 hypothetical protein AKJ47_00820 [candidate division MSBL1 archaeon SCGC-AAA261G05]
MKDWSNSGRREKGKLVEFVLRKYDVSPEFKLIKLKGGRWEKFTAGEFYFRRLGDPPDLERLEMVEEYGYPPELEELLERSYSRCLVIDNPKKIKGWTRTHEWNKQSNPFYSEHLAPYLDVFFEILENLLDRDFLIVYNQKKIEDFGMEGVGMIEEAFHYLHHIGKPVPIDHDELQRQAEKVLEEYTSR